MKVYFPNDNSTVFIPCSSGDDGCSPAYDGPTAVTPGATDVVLPTRHTTVTQDITVIGDPDLIPENIVQNVDIFGVQGEAVIPSLGTLTATANGTYTAPQGTGYDEVDVAVPASAVDSGTKSITSNGNNQDVVGYAAVDVNVPNSYTAGDEGKVVSSGALVAQTSRNITTNGTYDTTLNDEVVVNVSGGGGGGDNLPDFLANTIVAVNLPTLTSFAKAYAFRASSVTSVVLTGLTSFTAGASVFQDSASLTVCVMPNIASVAINTSSTWNRCTSLAALDLGLWRFGGSEMASCSSLTTVILRPLQVLELVSTNAFNGTPFASDGTGGTLYVPQSLISSYQSATNWSTILGYANNSIKAIEGSQYENYYADGTPIS